MKKINPFLLVLGWIAGKIAHERGAFHVPPRCDYGTVSFSRVDEEIEK